jgi:hypothetical protein
MNLSDKEAIIMYPNKGHKYCQIMALILNMINNKFSILHGTYNIKQLACHQEWIQTSSWKELPPHLQPWWHSLQSQSEDQY